MPNKIIEEKIEKFKKLFGFLVADVNWNIEQILEEQLVFLASTFPEVYEAGYKEGGRRGCRFCFSTDNR